MDNFQKLLKRFNKFFYSLKNKKSLLNFHSTYITFFAAHGSPVIDGGFTSKVDMKSGAPAFGTPKLAKTTLIRGKIARRYELPYRTSNVNACNTLNTQAGYESMMSLWPSIHSNCNFIKHASGWLERVLCALI